MAIELWFTDADPVPTHTLARAAFQIIHDINRRKTRVVLLYDFEIVKPEFRKIVNAKIREPSDFMKHADRGRVGMMTEVTFNPDLSRGFILFAITGLGHLGQQLAPEEVAFQIWHFVNKPEIFSDAGKKLFETAFDAKAVSDMRTWPKSEFFKRATHVIRNPPTRLAVHRESFMPKRRKPWIKPNDFETFRQSAVDHLDLPETYDEWLKLATEEEAKFSAVGITLNKVVVHPDEFTAYCLATGLKQNFVSFGGYVAAKSRQQEKG